MGTGPHAYPAEHGEAIERVMRVIDLLGACPDISDTDAVAMLVRDGISEIDAELLVRFVPCALSFAFLKLFGIDHFPSTFQVLNEREQWVEMPLADEHYFTSALAVGYEVTTHGYTERISKQVFQAVTQRSAEMGAVNEFFRSGGSREELAKGKFSPPTLVGLTAERIAAARGCA